MGNPEVSQVANSCDKLAEEGAGPFFLKLSLSDDVFEQFALFDVLRDEKKVFLCFDDLIGDPFTS